MRTPSSPRCPANVAPSCSISLRLSPSPSRPQPQNLRLAEGCAIALVIVAYLWVESPGDPTPRQRTSASTNAPPSRLHRSTDLRPPRGVVPPPRRRAGGAADLDAVGHIGRRRPCGCGPTRGPTAVAKEGDVAWRNAKAPQMRDFSMRRRGLEPPRAIQ